MTGEVPSGLHELEYARYLLEEILGWPAKSNLELIADCLRSIGRSRDLSRERSFGYMQHAIKLAKEQGIPVDRFFFKEGKYTEVRRQKPVECQRHPNLGVNDAGTCWGCYGEKYKSGCQPA